MRRPSNELVCIPNTEPFLSGYTGLQGARNIAYWDERRGGWHTVLLWEPLRLGPTSQVLLIRRPDAFYIHGLGDALTYLANHRSSNAAHGTQGGRADEDRARVRVSHSSRTLRTSGQELTMNSCRGSRNTTIGWP